ncbi:MAG: DUF1015 domain-containing protein [Clostridia bacterium]|nr:DUF1015 domain-containing protein [Clostridia bacterium]
MTKISVKVPDILLPNDSIDMSKWAVVACDQYTSEPDYWDGVKAATDGSPSALNVIFPEVYLSRENAPIIASINKTMHEYLDNGVWKSIGKGFVLLERSTPITPKRLGLVIAVDLEDYSFVREDKANIRATEGTVIERIPPRVRIRENAPVELPHIMLLIDDRNNSVIEPLYEQKDNLEKLYDFDLNMKGGHLTGWFVKDTEKVEKALAALLDEQVLKEKYGSTDEVMLFAVGDGNHSLATAKACWNNIKATLSEEEQKDHPARFALVEVMNLHDAGLEFEPIYRSVFEVDTKDFLDGLYKTVADSGLECNYKCYTYTTADGKKDLMLPSNAAVAVALVQDYIDAYIKSHPGSEVDYVHGEDSLKQVTDAKANRVAITLPPLAKNDLFDYVLKVGAFPRKTFSMGEAFEKRYYVEARKIK